LRKKEKFYIKKSVYISRKRGTNNYSEKGVDSSAIGKGARLSYYYVKIERKKKLREGEKGKTPYL